MFFSECLFRLGVLRVFVLFCVFVFVRAIRQKVIILIFDVPFTW